MTDPYFNSRHFYPGTQPHHGGGFSAQPTPQEIGGASSSSASSSMHPQGQRSRPWREYPHHDGRGGHFGGRGNRRGGGRGRGRGRDRGGGGGPRLDRPGGDREGYPGPRSFYKPSFIEDPWANLEKATSLATIGQHQRPLEDSMQHEGEFEEDMSSHGEDAAQDDENEWVEDGPGEEETA